MPDTLDNLATRVLAGDRRAGAVQQGDDRKQDPRKGDCERGVAAGIPERLEEPRRKHDEERGERAEAEQHQPEDARRDPPCPPAITLLEQLAEHGHERRRKRRVRDERPKQVRDLEGDRERFPDAPK